MKIHNTIPEDVNSEQFRSDAPSIKVMRVLVIVMAIFSATSLSGGLSSFLQINLYSLIGILTAITFFAMAWYFDKAAMIFGQSAVREHLLNKKMSINIGSSILLCLLMVIASFSMSKDGISYIVTQAREHIQIKSQVDTTLNKSLDSIAVKSDNQLSLKQDLFNRKIESIELKYNGKIASIKEEIKRREAQRKESNTLYIDKKIAESNKKIGIEQSKKGEEISKAMQDFEAEQNRMIAKSESIDSLLANESTQAAEMLKKVKQDKSEMDKKLSSLVSSIFAWSVVVMMLIGLKLTYLETRNGILPDPVLENSDISGSALISRFVMAIPSFVMSHLVYWSEKLYRASPERPTPILDNNIIDWKSKQGIEVALNKFDFPTTQSKEITKSVAKSERSKKPKDKAIAFQLIQMYLQSTDSKEVEKFYTECVEFLQGGTVNPFHRTRPIGYVTQGARDASYNATRYSVRSRHGFSDNSHGQSSDINASRADAFCKNCGNPFKKTTPHNRYCKDACRFEYNRKSKGHETEHKHGYKHKPSLKEK